MRFERKQWMPIGWGDKSVWCQVSCCDIVLWVFLRFRNTVLQSRCVSSCSEILVIGDVIVSYWWCSCLQPAFWILVLDYRLWARFMLRSCASIVICDEKMILQQLCLGMRKWSCLSTVVSCIREYKILFNFFRIII